jgi:hypothetical protein
MLLLMLSYLLISFPALFGYISNDAYALLGIRIVCAMTDVFRLYSSVQVIGFLLGCWHLLGQHDCVLLSEQLVALYILSCPF